MARISSCRACGDINLEDILSLGDQALTGRFPLPNEPDPPHGPLELVLCNKCGLLQLSHNYELSEMYGPTYGYQSSNNQTMIEHLEEIAEKLKLYLRSGDSILDIGSNDGTFLKMFEDSFSRTGIDPSSIRFKDRYPPDIELVTDFFSPGKVGYRKFQVITSIAMFYDINHPLRFMQDIYSLLEPNGIWFSEQGHMLEMINNLAYDSVCHEHLCYYNLRQIISMAKRAGLKILDADVNKINGASFSFIAARADSYYEAKSDRVKSLLDRESKLSFDSFLNFKKQAFEHRQQTINFFNQNKKVLGYGASTKGNVIIQFCGINKTMMPAIAEKYPWKFGKETPGTRIPIISEDEAKQRKPDYFFVFPYYFRDEIISREKEFLSNGGSLVFPLPKFEIVH